MRSWLPTFDRSIDQFHTNGIDPPIHTPINATQPHGLLLALLVGAAAAIATTTMLPSIRGVTAASMTRRSLLGFVRVPAQPAARLASSSPSVARTRRTGRASPCGAAAPAAAAAAPAAEGPQQLLDIYEFSEADLGGFLQERLGQPKYRAKQIRSWLYQRGAASFDEMLDLPKALRASLAEHFRLGR